MCLVVGGELFVSEVILIISLVENKIDYKSHNTQLDTIVIGARCKVQGARYKVQLKATQVHGTRCKVQCCMYEREKKISK